MLCMLSTHSADKFEILLLIFQKTGSDISCKLSQFFLIFPVNGLWHFCGDNLHEISEPVFSGK